MSIPIDPKSHWQRVYQTTPPTGVSWYEPVPEPSLALIGATGLGQRAAVLDVGGGASTLVDHLVAAGFQDLTVLDIAPAALEVAQTRLGLRAANVTWIEGDILSFNPTRRYALWHDRAVLHFLTEPAEQERYLSTLRAALQPAGHVILATFGPQGPTRCSGLPVLRHSPDSLGKLLGPRFTLRRSSIELHPTPGGQVQQFTYGWWQAEE
jgi:SAM-dependent methyltransferase